MRGVERAGRGNVAITLLVVIVNGHGFDARIGQGSYGGRRILLSVDELTQAPDDAAIVDARIIAQPARIETVLRAERRAEQRRPQVDSDDALGRRRAPPACRR